MNKMALISERRPIRAKSIDRERKREREKERKIEKERGGEEEEEREKLYAYSAFSRNIFLRFPAWYRFDETRKKLLFLPSERATFN